MPGRVARRLALAGLALCAMTPILVSALEVGRGWVPVSDTAIVATRARDVFTSRTPLLGQPSTAGIDVGEDVHHPGPLEYWTIALAQRVHDGPATSLVAVAMVNLAAVVVAVVVAFAVGGLPLAASTSAVLAALAWSLRGEVLVDPLNPYAALLPFAAFLACCVAATARRRWSLLGAVVLGSYAAQAHLTTAAMVVIAAFGTGLGLLLTRRSDDARWRRPALVAVAMLAACWSAPMVEAATRSGGNVAALLATGGARTPADRALKDSFDKSANALGAPPVWVRSGADVPSLLATPSALERVTVVGLIATAVALGVLARGRRSVDALTGGVAVAVTLIAGGTVLFARFPTAFFNVFALGNYLWLWPASALLWSVVLGGAVAMSPGPPRVRTVGGVLAAAMAGGFAVLAVADPTAIPVDRGNPAMVRSLSAQLAATLDREATYRFDLSGEFEEQAVDTGVVQELVRRGFDIRVTPYFAPSYDWRAGSADVDAVLQVLVDRDEPAVDRDRKHEVVASFVPPPDARRELERAERQVVRRLEADGGLDEELFPAFGKRVPTSVNAFVEGDFLTMAATGFLGDTAGWPETERLASARRQPVLRAVVLLRPKQP